MKSILEQAFYNLQNVSLWAWITMFVYIVSITAIYFFGLPFKKREKTNKFVTKTVSHGITNKTEKANVYNILYTEANAITLLGIMGILYIFVCLLVDKNIASIPIMFALSTGYSDMLDGLACKRHECHSKIGATLDPLRDRLAVIFLIFSLIHFIGITKYWYIPMFFVLVSELNIANIAIKARRNGKMLNSHGVGQQRQVFHLIMAEIILTSFFLLRLNTEEINITVFISSSIMAVASFFAWANYRSQYFNSYSTDK